VGDFIHGHFTDERIDGIRSGRTPLAADEHVFLFADTPRFGECCYAEVELSVVSDADLMSAAYSANELAKQLLQGSEFDTANAFAISHVFAATENLAEWKSLNSTSALIDLDAIVCEVREMNMSWQSKDAIVAALQTGQNAGFACKWALHEFKFNESGFLIAGQHQARA